MRVDDFVKSLAALLCWREERSNGINGMLAVLFVVRNRAKAGWNQGDWTRIIESHNQFSSMTIRGDSQTVLYPDPREPNFLRILQTVDGVYDDSIEDRLTDGALYYADLNSPAFHKGGWFDKTILANPDKYPRLVNIGTTTYFGDSAR